MLVSSSSSETHHDHSIIACSRHIYIDIFLNPHPVRGESHNQRNATGEVATIVSRFYKRICRKIVQANGGFDPKQSLEFH